MEDKEAYFKDLGIQVSRLKKRNDTLSKTLFVLFVGFVIAVCYVVYAEVFEPPFGKWPEIASQKSELEQENNRLAQLADSLTRANNIFLESSSYYHGVFYEIQIGAFEDFNLDAYRGQFVNLRPAGKTDNLDRYTLGKFKDYEQANRFLKDIRRMGIKDAFMLAKIDGERVTIKEARAKENL